MDCENLTFLSLLRGSFGAFWTIGNSALKNLSPKGGFMAWVGADVFKNDADRTDTYSVLSYTTMALPLDLFSTWGNVTSMMSAFSGMTFYTRPGYMQRLDFSHCLKLENLTGTFSQMSLNRLPIINSRKLAAIGSICSGGSITEVRSDDILPNEDGVAIYSNQAFSYAKGIKIFEFFNGFVKYDSYFMKTAEFANGAYMQIFETVPPSVTSDSLPPVSVLSSKDVWLYVPDESLDRYKDASVWRSLKDRMKPASEKSV
jgi:hypothetical protein